MARADDTELIDSFEEFYRSYYRNEIAELAQKYPNEQKSLYIDWQDLYRFDSDLADDFRNKPDQLREYAEEALRLYDLPVDVSLGQAHVRVRNLPETTDIRGIRSDHRGMLISVQGIIRKATDVRPKITAAAFECQRCGTLTRIPQEGGDFQEPHECQGCERQGPFRINYDQSEFIDAQKLRVQESPEGLRGGETPQNIDVNIEDDITGEVTPGDHVTATGILKLEQQGNDREKSAMFDVYMEGLTIDIEDEQFEEMEITDEDKKEIVELSNQPDIYEEMIGAIAPSIYGYEKEKKAMAFQLFSGVTKFLPDGSRTRGDLHILLVGDPGTGKCLKGDTSVTLGNGRQKQIRELVEENIDDPKPVDDGVYDTVDIPVPSLTADGQIEQKRATKVWKREAPDQMYQVTTASGRDLEVTPSHPLFVQSGGEFVPEKAEELTEGDEIAVAPETPPVADGRTAVRSPQGVKQDSYKYPSEAEAEPIESIETVAPDYDWVYDLEVAETHNYISDGVISHNSQLLQYIKEIAPRSVYTSGKGSSSAGLCVTGDTLIHTKDGLTPIRELAEQRHPDPVNEETAAEYERPMYTFDREEGRITQKESSHVWRMPPKECRQIRTRHGKELETSTNTTLLVCGEQGIEWKEIADIETGDYVAVPNYTDLKRQSPPVEEFFEFTNEKLKPTDESVEFLRTHLCEEFGTLRDAASELGLSEDFIYDSLSNQYLPQEKLDRILDAIDGTQDDITIERAMLRHGDSIRIPDEFDADLLYLAGLVFGDGDLMMSRRGGNRGHIRISNSNEEILSEAAEIIESTFDRSVEIEYQDDRVPCIRLHSATVARFFSNLGMETPKDSPEFDHKLTTAPHADAFLRGLFDADGSVSARDDGGSSVQFSTICSDFAQQVQLMLETYGIRARCRERDRRGTYELETGQTIESKSIQTHLEIYGRDIETYSEAIGFRCTQKSEALDRITHDATRRGERMPISDVLARTDGSGGKFYNNIVNGHNPSRDRARELLADRELGSAESTIEEVIEANLAWDEVVEAETTGTKELFDLTVPGTHNFIGNGIVTHNTAAAVRDDFGEGQQWTLEAGALVLADQGIAAVDELDKMRCVTGDTMVHTPDGITPIREFARRFETEGSVEELENGQTIRDIDAQVWAMTEDGELVQRPVTAVHEYDAPASVSEVSLESGERVTATEDHPFFVLSDGERTTKQAGELKDGDWVYVPDSMEHTVADGGVQATVSQGNTTEQQSDDRVSPPRAAILGYIAGDGNIYYNRAAGSYGIRFTNAEEELLADFERACSEAFDGAEPARYPSEQRDDGVGTVRLHGKQYADLLLDCGLNIENYDGKRVPEPVTSASRAAKAAFIRALADSEGTVGERNVRISSSSYELLLGAKMLLLEFGITSQIQTREYETKRDLYVLAVTADESLQRFRDEIGFTLSRKAQALASVCERTTGDRTILDVLPECGPLFEDARTALRLHQSECGLVDSTYCNFENGDANCSLRAAKQILDAFERRKEQAKADLERVKRSPSWERLSELRQQYHVSQSELSEETAYTQQQISRRCGTDAELKRAMKKRLVSIITEVAETSFAQLRSLITNDVKWRRVSSIEPTTAEIGDGQVRLQRHRLAELLDCPVDNATDRAKSLLATEPVAGDWDELRAVLDAHVVSFGVLAERFDVAPSTISRWFNERVDGEDFTTVREVAFDLLDAKRNRIRQLYDELGARQEPSVYDLTVEGTHNFVANGVVVHNSEDQSAMHEALEQQSYHPNSEILLSDGRRVEIGELVDEKFEANPEQAVDGIDCEILPTDDIGVHTVDLETNEVTKTDVDRVSRHEAPEEFVRVTFSNGRDVLVTPEHPMFVDQAGEIGTVDASNIEEGAFVPAPRKLPNSAQPVEMDGEAHIGKEKDIELPDELSADLGEILGLLTAEGHSYAGSAHEIGFSNQDERLLDRFSRLMSDVFGMNSSDTTNAAGTVTQRYISTKLYGWFESNVPEVMHTARDKRIPAAVLGASEEVIRRFLVGAFAGDGGVESEAMSFSTASEGLAEDYADALSKIGVASRIHYTHHEDAWKTYVMGDSTERFVEQVVEPADSRYKKAQSFVERSNETSPHHDVLPASVATELRELRSLVGLPLTGKFRPNIDNEYGVQVETVEAELSEIRKRIEAVRAELPTAETVSETRSTVGWSGRELAERLEGVTTSTIYYAEDGGYDDEKRQSLAQRASEAVKIALGEAEKQIADLESKADLRYYRVQDVETVPNEGEYACEWVYDVTVEPTNTFVSQGVVLHNSISVSKAGINATLKSRCSLLGAANPTYGRFDEFEPIGEQIDLAPPLISRFDLIFTVTDQPDEEKDNELAEHILQTNYAGELNTHRTETNTSNYTEEEVERITDDVAPTIDAEFLRKYVAYAQRNCYPTMTEEAKSAIQEFYVELRMQGSEEDAPVPVTARKLEAMVRLAEASARVRLSDTVTEEDAQRAIEIARYSLEDIGLDPETGELDADMIETGTSKSQRDRIKNVLQLIESIEDEYDEGAPVDVVIERAEEEGMDTSKAEHEIDKLKQKGEVYEPRNNHLRTT